jgi:predicted transposase/invertase (TIGR01784 family)
MKIINNNEPSPRFNPLNDYLFFKVMGEKGDEPQLLGFLNAVLGRSGKKPIESVEIRENKTFIKAILEGKSCILDVLAVLHNGTKVHIEVQLTNQYNMERRSLFYWSKVYLDSLNEGQDYRELPNVAAINIVDFDFPPKGNVHTCFHLREATDPSLILSPVLEIHFVNMVKWRRQRKKDLADPLNRWLAWFDEKSPPELIAEVANMDRAIMAARDRQDFITQNEQARRRYWSRRMAEHDLISNLNGARIEGEEIGRMEGRQEGRQEGEQIGEEKKTIEIARNALAEGAPPEFVQKITGLDMETINGLSRT